jgi:hypothetical protein
VGTLSLGGRHLATDKGPGFKDALKAESRPLVGLFVGL